jgi:hypothetical protein
MIKYTVTCCRDDMLDTFKFGMHGLQELDHTRRLPARERRRSGGKPIAYQKIRPPQRARGPGERRTERLGLS